MYKIRSPLFNSISSGFILLIILSSFPSKILAIIFDEVSSLQIWITISSLANKDPNNAKGLLFRQIELNWINAPLEDENDYIGLYLDNQPSDENVLPVSVHRLNNQTSGQIITDYYLPQIDFMNETSKLLPSNSNDAVVKSIYKLNNNIDLSQQPQQQQQQRRYNFNSDESNPPLINFRTFEPPAPISRNERGEFHLNEECVGYCIAYHSRDKILAKNCLRTNPSWMETIYPLISSRPLTSLMLPGTHNSATYSRQLDKNVLNMINKYQLNQDESIFNQLVYGIRHLDLRVGYTKVKQQSERFWIYHDIFRTEVTVREVLEQVKRFLDLTQREIVVMDFHRFTVGFQNEQLALQRERHARLINLIYHHLGQYIIPSYLGQHAPLSEFISMGKRLVIGYANKGLILGNLEYLHHHQSSDKQQVRDIDAVKQDSETIILQNPQNNSLFKRDHIDHDQQQEPDRRAGARLFDKLKKFKLISNSFSKRSQKQVAAREDSNGGGETVIGPDTMNNDQNSYNDERITSSLSKAVIFFQSVRHLWPNKDTVDGLASYMNETTCRKYFGELRSLMVELTPTVFGAISDKYDGNRKLAQQVNRLVNDWIRDRWLHCINIVASDYFLGNDLIRMSIYANRMRFTPQPARRNIDLGMPLSSNQCKSFRKIEHLLDKSKIPIQFAYNSIGGQLNHSYKKSARDLNDGNHVIKHTSSDGNEIYLQPLTPNYSRSNQHSYFVRNERKDSFVDNVADGFTNIVSSFKKLLNL